jgi:hypothetical protein
MARELKEAVKKFKRKKYSKIRRGQLLEILVNAKATNAEEIIQETESYVFENSRRIFISNVLSVQKSLDLIDRLGRNVKKINNIIDQFDLTTLIVLNLAIEGEIAKDESIGNIIENPKWPGNKSKLEMVETTEILASLAILSAGCSRFYSENFESDKGKPQNQEHVVEAIEKIATIFEKHWKKPGRRVAIPTKDDTKRADHYSYGPFHDFVTNALKPVLPERINKKSLDHSIKIALKRLVPETQKK